MVRTVIYFPTAIVDLGRGGGGGAIFLLTFQCCTGKWCTLVRLTAVNPEKYVLAFLEAFFTGEEITLSAVV